MTAKKFTCNAYKKMIEAQYDSSSYDVRFIFPNSKEIPAHKKLLSSLSRVFLTMFDGNGADGSVMIDDSSHNHFGEFMKYFYDNELEVTVTNAPHLLKLAKKYDVEDVAELCISHMMKHMSVNTVTDCLFCAVKFNIDQLVVACQTLISSQTSKVLKSEAFLRCEELVLSKILELDSIECNESVMFDAIIEWAKASCERKKIDTTNYENIRNELGNCLYLIRFTAMDRKAILDRRNVFESVIPYEKLNTVLWDHIASGNIVSQTRSKPSNYHVFNFAKIGEHQKCDLLPLNTFSFTKAVIFTGLDISNVYEVLTNDRMVCPYGLSGIIELHYLKNDSLNSRVLILEQKISVESDSPTVAIELQRGQVLYPDSFYTLSLRLKLNHKLDFHSINMYNIATRRVKGVQFNVYVGSEGDDNRITAAICCPSFISEFRFRELDRINCKEFIMQQEK